MWCFPEYWSALTERISELIYMRIASRRLGASGSHVLCGCCSSLRHGGVTSYQMRIYGADVLLAEGNAPSFQ